MCWITKKAHQKAIDKLNGRIGSLNSRLGCAIDDIKHNEEAIQSLLDIIDAKLGEHVAIYHTSPFATPPTPDIFDPKAEEYPTELAGMTLAFVTVKRREGAVGEGFPELNCVEGANELKPYQLEGDNTAARRINVNPARLAVAIESPTQAPDRKLYIRDGKPYPWVFDSGAKAYRVCPKQVIDGRNLSDLPPLYLKVEDVKEVL
jgi:hypothetical protein